MGRIEEKIQSYYAQDLHLRGYQLNNYKVSFEPLISKQSSSSPQHLDDSKVPSLLEHAYNLLLPREQQAEKKAKETLTQVPKIDNYQTCCMHLHIKRSEGDAVFTKWQEFLIYLSVTRHPLSFEVIATKNIIHIQIVVSTIDRHLVITTLKAYFPNIRTEEVTVADFPISENSTIVDFGLENEIVLPTTNTYKDENLTALFAILEKLSGNQTVILQYIFKGIEIGLSQHLKNLITNPDGASIFIEPEMSKGLASKIESPLFSVVMRLAVMGNNRNDTARLAEMLVRNISLTSGNQHNKLIPLTNEGYPFEYHLNALQTRTSFRSPMVLNTDELRSWVHIPNLLASKLYSDECRSKKAPVTCIDKLIPLGINYHDGEAIKVGVSKEHWGHCLVAGATSSGKSYLLCTQLRACTDEAVIVLDPHGKLIQDYISGLSKKQAQKVVHLDFGNYDTVFGLNIFQAESEMQKAVLAGNLISTFKKVFMSSGDRLENILQKTITTFVYSSKNLCLMDIKPFLLNTKYRDEILVDLDPLLGLHFYWNEEYPLVARRELTPLFTRLDRFIANPLLRNIFSVRDGLNLKALINQKAHILCSLPVGHISENNSVFLAEIIINQLNRIAMGRQSQPNKQHPHIRLFVDEAHLYCAKSDAIKFLLNSTNKYKLNVIAATQSLSNFDTETLDIFLTNCQTQCYFRLNDKDSKRVASTLSYFTADDLMEQERGEAICRIVKRSNDFNIKTITISQQNSEEEAQEILRYVNERSVSEYAFAKAEIEALQREFIKENKPPPPKYKISVLKKEPKVETSVVDKVISKPQIEKETLIARELESEGIRTHTYLQNFIKRLAQQRDFSVTTEYTTKEGNRIDLLLEQGKTNIAFEIAVTNKKQGEVNHIKATLKAGIKPIAVVSKLPKHLRAIARLAEEVLTKAQQKHLYFLSPQEVGEFLDTQTQEKRKNIEIVKGYRIQTEIEPKEFTDSTKTNSRLARILGRKK